MDVLLEDDDDRDLDDEKMIKRYHKMFPSQRENLIIIVLRETNSRQNRIIGTASLFIDETAKVSQDDEEKVGFIDDICVDIDYRGKDEVVVLLDGIKALAWATGCEKCLIKADNSKNGLKFEGKEF